ADAAMRWGVGAGASRLVSGNMTVHRRLEERIAEFKRSSACVLFGSGYLANTGVVSTLAGEGEVVFSDALNHASIVDGCRLSRAETFVYDHCDTEHLEWGLREAGGGGALIVTDGVFSMVGASARLEEEVDVVVGTLGKALGSYGAYVCCDKPMAKWLVNSARTLIFSTALPPPAVAGAAAALDILVEQPGRVDKLRRNAQAMRDAFTDLGVECGDSETQILPLVVGDAAAAVSASE